MITLFEKYEEYNENDISSGDYEKNTYNSEILDDVTDILSRIKNERAKHIIEHYYGLNGKKKMSLKELGEYWGVSGERIRQLKRRILYILKDKNRIYDKKDTK